MGVPQSTFGRLSSEQSSPESESLACSFMGDLMAVLRSDLICEAEFLCLLNRGDNLDRKSYYEGEMR